MLLFVLTLKLAFFLVKLYCYLSLIPNGKLVIMFSNLGGSVRFPSLLPFVFASFLHICIQKESRLVSYIACVDAADGRSIVASSNSSWNN